MHEASVSQSIVRTILENAAAQKAVRVESVELEIGELTFLNIEQVVFWVQTGLKGTVAENARIITSKIPVKIKCNACRYKGPVKLKESALTHYQIPVFHCDRCGSDTIEVIEGKELTIPRIQIVRASERTNV